MPKPTVLMVLYGNPDRYPPTVNAANVLAESGFHVVLASRDGPWTTPPAEYHPGVMVKRLSAYQDGAMGRIATFTEFVAEVSRLAKSLSPVALIGYDMHGLLAARLARWRAPEASLVYHCHDVWKTGFRPGLTGLAKALEASGAREADCVVLPDRQRAERFRAAARLQRDPLVVANAPRLSKPAPPGLLRLKIGPLARNKRIVFRHGMLGPGHALETTAASMHGWGEDALLVLMGEGPTDFRHRLHRLAEASGCANRLVFLEAVGYPRTLEYLADVDVGLALYDKEGDCGPWAFAGTASNKALEFLAAGVPFVVDGHPASQMYIDEGVAVRADPSDPASVGQTIGDLLAHDGRRRAMGEQGRRLHERGLNFEAQFVPLLDHFRSCHRR